ncbi:NepR family anti-sigma factor [Microvirga terricola]|uniref:Anti-sigma factor NepR domain-containing protein n=1 Tax=Microvirga terricola TaxID=2719797 RepID=A0ABX0VC64_9HYPH|nr:NepR family anti-sigma factor [Microvirga terricola]NIX76290.1 hypothetical protein [Microvirga terricola]
MKSSRHLSDFEPTSEPHKKSPAVSRTVQAQLGLRLRQFYESLALGEQPVPDRFVELIDRLTEGLSEKAQP